MLLFLSLAIRCIRFFRSGVQTKTRRFVVNLYFGQPFIIFFTNARKTAFIAGVSSIVRVLHVCRLAQILKSIILAVAVNVVNLIFRPFILNVKPSQSMREIERGVETNDAVSVSCNAPGYIAFAASPPAFCPSKHACFWSVANQLLQSSCRKIHSLASRIRDFNNINAVVYGGQAR